MIDQLRKITAADTTASILNDSLALLDQAMRRAGIEASNRPEPSITPGTTDSPAMVEWSQNGPLQSAIDSDIKRLDAKLKKN